MKRFLSVLGSTGSIGTQTLDVARKLGLKVCAVAANRNIRLLEKQIREFKPDLAAVFDESAARDLKIAVADLPVRVVSGMEGLCEAASYSKADLICNSVVGLIGLQPTLAAIAAKKDIALANKETLVAGGAIVMKAAKAAGVKILPVDSEHSAIFQCLQGCPDKKILKRIILTASGGPFFGWSTEQLKQVTPEQALRHPNWNMGPKVTIDSATMMNKGLEIMEASWLFDLPASKIDVLVQRESVVHSLIEYVDNSVIAQLGVPDMRIPIQYAITWPERYVSPVKQLDLAEYATLTFARADEETFRCLRACRNAMQRGGLAPAAANGANEVAVRLFLEHKISFTDIGELVSDAAQHQPDVAGDVSVDDILNADAEARRYVLKVSGCMR
ncbi:MAG: 1-deoxy-D-xylulose 5-phosphate reductoisomerase [Thermocaproicibacter melissae]|jgi:1-deoxy-D-xylulose-5-phosphate reductoisomerase|uniref:1-deoxy-D-xylulose-5-phosphate reductoisomerase n=1 Tax=Thermocaproicibacter melissae TaxID=2966552 RepID=UPI0024B16E46|nr:1-deoxy-D-xylulose-5-phosphate reductoisomerase [Thermocaproicibacter melissae]WBY64843.1 1-deoxy-D-xylulose-5-phosphate reductoisomerase [Thermocaproicibacter melissae]